MEMNAGLGVVELVVQMIDALGVERRRAPLDAVDLVALREQELGEIGAILARDTGDECALVFHRFWAAVPIRKGRDGSSKGPLGAFFALGGAAGSAQSNLPAQSNPLAKISSPG